MQLDEPRPAKHARQACGPARQLAAHATTAAPHAIFLYQGQSPRSRPSGRSSRRWLSGSLGKSASGLAFERPSFDQAGYIFNVLLPLRFNLKSQLPARRRAFRALTTAG